MKQKVLNYFIALVSAAVLVVLDQITKILAIQYLAPQNGGRDVIIIADVFRLKYLRNYGAAFGMLQGQKTIFFIITIVVLAAICFFYSRIPNERRYRILQIVVVFLTAGAIGNFIDRMYLGYVIDFLYFELINFPIFNVADIYVTCSLILFVILILFYYKDEEINRILSFKKKKVGK